MGKITEGLRKSLLAGWTLMLTGGSQRLDRNNWFVLEAAAGVVCAECRRSRKFPSFWRIEKKKKKAPVWRNTFFYARILKSSILKSF